MSTKLHDQGNQPFALSVTELTYAFSDGAALFQRLSFDIREGEFVSLLAPSGIGKTTLFRLLIGLLVPHTGTITLASSADPSSDTRNGCSGRIGYMPQRDSLMPWRSVLDNAGLGLELAGMSKREARRRVLDLLPAFGLEGTETKYPHELSGGMRQRVSFLRSVLGGGDLLLLDEPFSALDAMTRVSMQEWLLKVWEQHNKTILFITHDIDEALLLSDRVLVAKESPVKDLHELAVTLPRPRTYETVLDSSFADLKRKVLELLGRHNDR